jgi:hypothetical protein
MGIDNRELADERALGREQRQDAAREFIGLSATRSESDEDDARRREDTPAKQEITVIARRAHTRSYVISHQPASRSSR